MRFWLFAGCALAAAGNVHAQSIIIGAGTTSTVQLSLGGTDALLVEAGGTLSVADTAIRWNSAATDLRIENHGLIESVAPDGRAINAGGSVTAPRYLTLSNAVGGTIRSENDAIRINTDITAGSVSISNAGLILATGTGQAIDLYAIASTVSGQIMIRNLAGGVIRSTDADAVRPGEQGTVDNAGVIDAGGTVNLASDGVDFQEHAGTVINRSGGLITGARHGITTDVDLFVVNEAGATILGRNGSGVGSDGNGTVINYGTITGAYGGGVGDGDGVDIDYVANIQNYGLIEALGAGIPEGDSSEGVAMGTGKLTNFAGATIRSVHLGFWGANDILLVNAGTIEGTLQGIVFAGGSNVVINSGTIRGGIFGALTFEAGTNELVIREGSVIEGAVYALGSHDTLRLEADLAPLDATGFEYLEVAATATLRTSAQFAHTHIESTGELHLGAWSGGMTGGTIFNEGALVVEQEGELVYDGILSGSGSLRLAGTGDLRLTGGNTLSGDIIVGSGRLLLDDLLQSPITVESGGALEASVPVAALYAQSGSDISVKQVTGDLVLSPGATLNWDGATAITVGGHATLGGNLRDVPDEQTSISRLRRITILEAAQGIGGLFENIYLPPSQDLAASVEYGQSTVNIVWRRTDIRFADAAFTQNQTAVANMMQGAKIDDPLRDSILVIEDGGQARQAFDALSGEMHASVDSALIAEDIALRPLLVSPAAGDGVYLWGRGIIGSANLDGTQDVHEYGWKRKGIVAGLRYGSGDLWLGVAGGKASEDSEQALNGAADINSSFIGGDAGAALDRFRIHGGVFHAWHDISANRGVAYSGVSQSLAAKYDANSTQLFGNIEYAAVKIDNFQISPFAGVAFLWAKRDGFTETGGSTALDIASSSRSLQIFDLGLLSTATIEASPTVTLHPRLRAGWQGARGDTASDIDASIAGTAGMAIIGQSVARDRIAWDLGMGIDFGRAQLDLGWQAAAGSGAFDHVARIGLSIALN